MADPSFVLTPLLAGALLNCVLSGYTSSEALVYYQECKRDPVLVRWTVLALFILDIVYTLLTCATPWRWLVVHFGEPHYPFDHWETWAPTCAITAIVTLAVQCFFSWRIHILSNRKKLLPAIILVLALISCAFGISATPFVLRVKHLARFGEYRWAVSVWLGLAAVADLAITAGMFIYLKGEAAHEESRFIVNRVLAQSLKTNAVTALLALVDLVVYVAMPQDAWHLLLNELLAKFYFLSLLISLTSRRTLAARILRRRNAGATVRPVSVVIPPTPRSLSPDRMHKQIEEKQGSTLKPPSMLSKPVRIDMELGS